MGGRGGSFTSFSRCDTNPFIDISLSLLTLYVSVHGISGDSVVKLAPKYLLTCKIVEGCPQKLSYRQA